MKAYYSEFAWVCLRHLVAVSWLSLGNSERVGRHCGVYLAPFTFVRQHFSFMSTSKHLQATLTEGPVHKHLRDMALPMVWGLLATMSFNLVDTFFVAQLGDAALAAMSFTFPVIMFITSVAIGLGAGTSSAVARAIGRGDQESARRLATDAVSLTALIAISCCFIGWMTIEPLFKLLGASDELIPLIHDYMSIWYFGAPLLMIPMVSLSALRAMGLSQVQGYLMSCAAILNAMLDPILIFGLWGFPRMELEGAALATVITRAFTLVVAFYILHRRLNMLVNPFVCFEKLVASWKAITHVGLPAMLANVMVPLSSGVVVALVASYGHAAVAGFGVAVRIEPLALIVFYALSGVVGPFFGQNLGVEKYQRLFSALKVVTVFCFSFGLVLAIVLWGFAENFAAIFSESNEILMVAVLYLSIVPMSYGAYGLVMSVSAAFNGLGLPMPSIGISFMRVLGVFLPLALLGKALFDLQGLFIAVALANFIVGLVAYLWLRKTLYSLSASGHIQAGPSRV